MEKALSFLLILVVLIPYTYGLSIGYLAKQNYIKINENETARFGLLFWNSGDGYYQVELAGIRIPENFTVIIKPDRFQLSKDIGLEYVLISNSQAVKATPVDVIIIPPKNTAGVYSININQKIISNNTGIVFLPESIINLRVDIGKPVINESLVVPIVIEKTEDLQKNEEMNNNLFYIFIFLTILVISAILYKLS